MPLFRLRCGDLFGDFGSTDDRTGWKRVVLWGDIDFVAVLGRVNDRLGGSEEQAAVGLVLGKKLQFDFVVAKANLGQKETSLAFGRYDRSILDFPIDFGSGFPA